MGVTIHFEGRLRDDDALANVLAIAAEHAESNGWASETLDRDHDVLNREIDEESCDYEGPVRGVALYPHEDCEPVRLEFDADLFVQEFTKTQFAGVAIHCAVVALLRDLEPHFVELEVFDEGEYWDSGDLERLEEHCAAFDVALADFVANNPNVAVKVHLPGGRIADIVE